MAEPDPSAAREDEAEARPWEQPGQVRRDVEPHRGPWLLLVGWIGLGFAALTVPLALVVWLELLPMPSLLIVSEVCGLCALVGFALGVAALGLGGRDLARMRAGAIDPAGEKDADRAVVLGIAAAAVSLFFGCGGLFVR